MSRFKVFQYEICDRMSHLGALYENFEIFQKKFQWERIFENRGVVCEILTDFQSKDVFELTKYWRINFSKNDLNYTLLNFFPLLSLPNVS